jgi:hypothetical protein
MDGMLLLRSDTAYERGDTGAGPLVGIGVKVAITRNVYVQSNHQVEFGDVGIDEEFVVGDRPSG